MSKDNQICRPGDLSELHRIRQFIMQKASKFGFSDDESQKIALAVDEACSNLIQHAYKMDKRRKICIEVQTAKGEFTVSIRDSGHHFDPNIVPIPNMDEYFKQFKTGGLGIHLMRSVMDDIKYFPSKDKKKNNVLMLTKRLN